MTELVVARPRMATSKRALALAIKRFASRRKCLMGDAALAYGHHRIFSLRRFSCRYRFAVCRVPAKNCERASMIDTAIVLLVVAVLLVVVAGCQPLAGRLRLPPTALLGAVGVALGALPSGLAQLGWSGSVDAFADMFGELPISSATYIYVFLPLL